MRILSAIRIRHIFTAALAFLAGAAVYALLTPELHRRDVAAGFIATAVFTVWTYLAAVRPAEAAQRGLRLLKSQEINNRLAAIGEPGADRVVKLFNSLMDRLSDERAKLLEQEHLLNSLIEVSPSGIAIMDYDGNFELVNPAFLRMTGCDDPARLTGRGIGAIPGELGARIAAVPAEEKQVIRMPDMEVFLCRRTSFLERGFPKPIIMLDRLTDEVRRSEREAYGKVVRVIAHEVNNSLGSIRTLLELIEAMPDLDPEFRPVVRSCSERAENLASFIKGYSDIVKIPEPMPVIFDLNRLLRDMRPFLAGFLPADSELCLDLSNGELEINADQAMMQQVIVNIVKNSSESIALRRNPGIITIRTISGAERRMEIDDNGAGISPGIAEHLFSPFHTTKPGGQGLGLTFTSEVLHAHHFTFSLRTVAPFLTRFAISFRQ